MDTYVDRLDAHGLTIWLPPMPSASAAEIIRQDVAELAAQAADAEAVLPTLDSYGWSLILRVEHHGPQTYRIWTIAPRPVTWAAARVAEAQR